MEFPKEYVLCFNLQVVKTWRLVHLIQLLKDFVKDFNIVFEHREQAVAIKSG